MNRPAKILVVAGVAIALAGIIKLWQAKRSDDNMLDKISDEGYETASDVLFPNRKSRRKKLHYGPVLRA